MNEDVKDDLKQKLQEDLVFDQLKKDTDRKKLIIESQRTKQKLEELKKAQVEMELAKTLSFNGLTDPQIASIRSEMKDYFQAASKRHLFIDTGFNALVPFFKGNLVLVGAPTGKGKSTCMANIIYGLLTQEHLKDQKPPRILYISNEERPADLLNRVTCLFKGWAYVNHDQFSQEQVQEFDKWIDILSRGGLTVVDDNFGGMTGLTTSIEGMDMLLKKLTEDMSNPYDVVLIDYYQNVASSKVNSAMNEYECQAKFARQLNDFKNVYPAPIVLMCQIDPPSKENTPFTHRIKGRKLIKDFCMDHVEMIPNFEDRTTEFEFHKSRFTQSVGRREVRGFEKGKFVPYNADFQAKMNEIKERENFSSFDSQFNGNITKKS